MTFGLLGHQIGYSLSPVIHRLIAGKHFSYELFDIAPDDLEKAVIGELSVLSGFNVTIPYKQRIMQYCRDLDPLARKIGAVNTVQVRNGGWTGYNTDYLGFMQVIREHISDFLSLHPVLIGYGGVARAAVFGLETLGFHTVSVLGGESSRERADFIRAVTPQSSLQILEAFPDKNRLWINCTPVGSLKSPHIPENYILFNNGDILYDLNYAPSPTHLEELAAREGIRTLNGMRMLVCQAIEAQKIWRGNAKAEDIDIDAIIRSIRR